MTTHYFPDGDEPGLQAFTQAFVRMMFAHSAFEHRVSDLMGVITGVVGFGERPERRWSADKRPKLMKKLIDEYHPEGLPETTDIQFHFAVTVICLHMDRGGSSTLKQTQSRCDLGSNGPNKISIGRSRWPKSKTPLRRSTILK